MRAAVKDLMNTYTYFNSMAEFHCKPSLFSSLFPVVVIKGFSFSLNNKMQILVINISLTAQDDLSGVKKLQTDISFNTCTYNNRENV